MSKPCHRCRGQGKSMPEHGFTKADMVTCETCNGSGTLPQGYIINRNGNKRRLIPTDKVSAPEIKTPSRYKPF